MTAVRPLLACAALILAAAAACAATYHVDPVAGDDRNAGTARDQAWRTLERAGRVALGPGDSLLLLAGVRHAGRLHFEGLAGTAERPVAIGSYGEPGARALVDGRGTPAAVSLRNCRHVVVSDLVLTADGGAPIGPMRCGVHVTADGDGDFGGITLRRLHVKSVSFADPGHVRPDADVRTANGRERYGWGIRFIVPDGSRAVLRDLVVRDCRIERVDHTGLKFTAPADGIRDVLVEHVAVSHSGGPGIQLSGVTGGRFRHLSVDHSGSTADTRNWGRGSGLWTWGSKDVVVERSRFTDANGPADSAGVHIDFNCEHVVVQHNFSARNAGGFCEILGHNRNCAYRYNISVDDGHRVKGRGGAFQEGKVLWLSGYVGDRRRPTGPFDSYIYNNTIVVSAGLEPRFAFAPTAEGVLVANNLFVLAGPGRRVAGDQGVKDDVAARPLARAVMAGNLFLRADAWPAGLGLADAAPVVGDPRLAAPGGPRLEDYLPADAALVKDRGIVVAPLPGDPVGLKLGLAVATDILGRPIVGAPDIGAIELP